MFTLVTIVVGSPTILIVAMLLSKKLKQKKEENLKKNRKKNPKQTFWKEAGFVTWDKLYTRGFV